MRPATVRQAREDAGKEPLPLFITDRFDDECIALPMTNVPSEPARFRRLVREFSSVGPDGAPSVRQFEELQYPVRQHDKFDSVVVRVQTASAHRITIDLRSAAEAGSVLIAKRFAVLVLIANRRFMLLLPPFRQRWRSADPAQSVKTPDAGKI